VGTAYAGQDFRDCGVTQDTDSKERGSPSGGSRPYGSRVLWTKMGIIDPYVRPCAEPSYGAAHTAPEYASPDDALNDRTFKGGHFWVSTGYRPIAPLSGPTLAEALRVKDLVAVDAEHPPVVTDAEQYARYSQMGSIQNAPKDTNPKTIYGESKPAMSTIPGAARVMIAEAMRLGTAKYGRANWREDPVSSSTYVDALERHLAAWIDGEELDPESGVSHLAHVAANACIIMDAQACGTLLDDRPPAGVTGKLIKDWTRKNAE
jgi:hypothetical protein